MISADHSHEEHRSNQYTEAQDRHSRPGPTGYYNNTETGDPNSLGTTLSSTSTRSSIPSRTISAPASTTANTASTSRTSMGSSSSSHPAASCDIRHETDVATAPTQSDRATTKAVMYCVGCWEPKGELTKHYRKCSYIQGNWAFWACAYTLEVFGDQQAFINHIKSFKPDEKRVAGTKDYVTARDWAVDFTEDAKKRQLVNTVFAYFGANPGLAEEWRALNNGELIPDLNNVGDVGKILTQSSILRRRPPLGPARSVETVSINQLQQLFQAGKAGANTQTEADVSSKKQRRNNTPVLYNALGIVNRDARVSIGDANFDSAELAERQQQQLHRQNQERFVRYGGVVVYKPSDREALAPTDTPRMARTPSTFEEQIQGTNVVPTNALSNPAEAHHGLQANLMDHGGLVPPPPVTQAPEQTQGTIMLAAANETSIASDDDHDDDEMCLDFWVDPDCGIGQPAPI